MMKAVVFKGPGKVVVEDRPIPKIQDPGDVIVKIDKVPSISITLTVQANAYRLHYAGGILQSSNHLY